MNDDRIISSETEDRSDALVRAVKERNATAVRALLSQGADPNAPYRLPTRGGIIGEIMFGTPETVPVLFLACAEGPHAIARLLMEAGADLNSRSQLGLTPLMLAANLRRKPVIQDLIRYGADLDARCNQGRTALMSLSDDAPALALEMLAAGADPNIQDNDGVNALHRAAYSQSAEMVTALLQAGVPVDSRDHEGRTPLMRAMQTHWTEVALTLLEAGARVDAVDLQGKTPLMWAGQHCRVGPLRELLARGADPNARDVDGKTPLMWLVTGNVSGVRLLLAAGVDPLARDRSGKTARDWALELMWPPVAAILEKAENSPRRKE